MDKLTENQLENLFEIERGTYLAFPSELLTFYQDEHGRDCYSFSRTQERLDKGICILIANGTIMYNYISISQEGEQALLKLLLDRQSERNIRPHITGQSSNCLACDLPFEFNQKFNSTRHNFRTTHCPNRLITREELKELENNPDMDYKNGKWIYSSE